MASYIVIPPNSGESEVAKAKKRYQQGVACGEFIACQEVIIRLTKLECQLVAEYINKNTLTSLGSTTLPDS